MTPLWLSLSCAHKGPAHPAPAALSLAQDGRVTPLRDRGVYTLDRRPFALRFPLPVYEPDGARHAAQVAGSADPAVLGIEPGHRTDEPQGDHMFFAPGMGMAVDASGGYESFVLRDNHAHHYLVDIPSDPRMRRVTRLGPDSPDVAFAVSAFDWEDRTYSIADLPLDEVYLAVFVDRDLDDFIDPGELVRFTLRLR